MISAKVGVGSLVDDLVPDVLARWHRMKGCLVNWMPGPELSVTPAGAVAPEALARVRQRRLRLGTSLDWTLRREVEDPPVAAAVRRVFSRLNEAGYVFRTELVVDFCPSCGTALDRADVSRRRGQGTRWRLRYPAADGGEGVVVATARPETLAGDVAVAVDPADPELGPWVGRTVNVPVIGRPVPVIAEAGLAARGARGSAVRVTPAEDVRDFLAALQASLAPIRLREADGSLSEAWGAYRPFGYAAAGTRLREALETGGFIEGEEPCDVWRGHCNWCGTVTESRLATQWFVRMRDLSKAALEAVGDGRARFVPAASADALVGVGFEHDDWCVSRQGISGIRVPAFHCKTCGAASVSAPTPGDTPGAAAASCETVPSIGAASLGAVALGASVPAGAVCSSCGGRDVHADADVFDPWFVAACWPLIVPARLPAAVVIADRPGVRAWVGRLIGMSLHFAGTVPALEICVRASLGGGDPRLTDGRSGDQAVEQGAGDPLERLGADAARMLLAETWNLAGAPPLVHQLASASSSGAFSVAASASGAGRAVEERADWGKALAQRLWTAARLILNSGSGQTGVASTGATGPAGLAPEDRWLLGRCSEAVTAVDTALELYDIRGAARAAAEFVGGDLCEWWLELARPRLNPVAPPAPAPAPAPAPVPAPAPAPVPVPPVLGQGGAGDGPLPCAAPPPAHGAGANEACLTAAVVARACLSVGLRLVHPFMPHVTERIWAAMPGVSGFLADGGWPAKGEAPALVAGALAGSLGAPAGSLGAPVHLAPLEGSSSDLHKAMVVAREAVAALRALRAKMQIPPSEPLPVIVRGVEPGVVAVLKELAGLVGPVARACPLEFGGEGPIPVGAVRASAVSCEVWAHVVGAVDVLREGARLERELAAVRQDLARVERKLSNEDFLRKAPAGVVEKEHTRRSELAEERRRLEALLVSLAMKQEGR